MKGLKTLHFIAPEFVDGSEKPVRVSTEVYSQAFVIKFDYSMFKFDVNATVSRALRNMAESCPSASFKNVFVWKYGKVLWYNDLLKTMERNDGVTLKKKQKTIENSWVLVNLPTKGRICESVGK